MSVGFDVSANTQSAQAALRQLQDAFRQLQREGQKFTEIDLSQLGTDQLSRDLKAIVEQWKRMVNARGSVIRGSGQADRAPWDVDMRQAHPNASAADLQRKLQQMIENLLHGTSGNSPELPRPPDRLTPPSSQQARDEENRKRQAARDQHNADTAEQRAKRQREHEQANEERETQRRRQMISGGIMGGMKFTAGLAGVQTGLDAIQSAYQGANDIGRYTDEFMRRTQDVGHDFGFLREQITGVGRHLGVVSDESAKLTLAFTRTAHAATIDEARAGTQAAVGLASGFGSDKDQTVQQMARMSLIGAPGAGSLTTTHKKFALLIGQTVGQHNVPLEKGLADFSRLAESSAARTTQAPPSESIAGYLKSLYDVAGKRPGLKGESGMSLLGAADEGFRNADNPAVNVLMFRALAGRMGTQNWLEIQEQKEKGAFAPVGKDGETNFGAFFKEIKKQFGGLDKNYTAYALNNALGLGGMGRAKALIDIEENRKNNGGVDGYQKDLARHGIDLEKLDESGIKDLSDIFKNADPAQQFAAAKTKYNSGSIETAKPLSDTEKAALGKLESAAGSGKKEDQDAFVSAVAQAISNHGMKASPYSVMETELAQIKSAMIDKVGGPIVDGLSTIASILQKGLGVTPEQAEAEKKYTESQKKISGFSRTSSDELNKAKSEMEAARGTAAFPEKVQAYQDTARRTRDQYHSMAKERDQEYRDSGNLNFIPPIAPEEDALYNKLKQGKDQNQHEIERLQAELSRLNLNPLDSEWWNSSEEQRAQRAKELEERGPAIKAEIAKLKEQEEQAKKSPVRRASGGRIPGGVGGGDRVSAKLTPGEFVVNPYAAQKNQPLLNQINSGATPGTDEETPATVRELQKRLEQLFDPVTRYLAELAAGARALQAGRAGTRSGFSGTGAAAVLGAGPGVTTADGTPVAPLTDAARFDAQKGLSTAGVSATSSVSPYSTGKFPGDGKGFLSQGSRLNRPENLPGFVGPPAPGGESSPSAKAATHGGSAGGLDTPPSTQAVMTGDAGSASNPGGAKPLLDAISKAEGTTDAKAQKHGYASGYDVTLGYGKFGGKPGEGKPLSQMTVGEVKQLQKAMLNHPDNNLNSSAVGKYQVVGKTLRGLQPQMGFKDSDTFSPELQDKIGEQLLKGRGLEKFRKGQISAGQFQGNIANEWASIPHTGTGRATQHTGTSETEIQSAIAASKNATPAPVPPPALAANSEDDHRAGTAAMTKAVMDQQIAPKSGPPEFTQKPKEKIPDASTDMQQAGGAAGGVGHLDITLIQADASGARTGADVNHRMNLRTSRPHGAVSVSTVNRTV